MVIDIFASLFGTALIIVSWVFIYTVGVTDGIEKATRYDHDNDPDDVIIFDHTHHGDLKNQDPMVK